MMRSDVSGECQTCMLHLHLSQLCIYVSVEYRPLATLRSMSGGVALSIH